MSKILNPYFENFHAYNGKLHERYTTSIYNIAYDTFADNDIENLLAGYVEPDKLLDRAREIVFNFDYGLIDEEIKSEFLGNFNLKKNFEEAFIAKYLTDEIAYESFTLWKTKLRGKLIELTPIINMQYKAFIEMNIEDLRGGYSYKETLENTHNDNDVIASDRNDKQKVNENSENTKTGFIDKDITEVKTDNITSQEGQNISKEDNETRTSEENTSISKSYNDDGTISQVDSGFPVNEVNAYQNLTSVNYASNGLSNRQHKEGTSDESDITQTESVLTGTHTEDNIISKTNNETINDHTDETTNESVRDVFTDNINKENEEKYNETKDNNGGYKNERDILKIDRDIIDNMIKIKDAYNDMINNVLLKFNYLFMGIM